MRKVDKIPSLEETVDRKVVADVLEELQESLKLDNYDLKIPSKLEEESDDNNRGLESKVREIKAYYKVMPNDNIQSLNAKGNCRTEALIDDKDIEFKVTPVFFNSKMTIEIKFSDKNASGIKRIKHLLQMAAKSNKNMNVHVLNFNYILSNSVLHLSKEILIRKYKIDKTLPTNIFKYLSTISNKEFREIRDVNSKNSHIMFNHVVTNVLGYITTDVFKIEEAFDKEKRRHFFKIEYELSFNRPDYFKISYDPIIYNQPLSKVFTSETANSNKQRRNSKHFADDDISKLKGGHLYIEGDEEYLKIPRFDDFILPKDLTSYRRMFSVLITIDGSENELLLNLNQLLDIRLTKTISTFLRAGEYKFMTKILQSIFYLNIYENEYVKKDLLTVDEDLNVYAKVPLNIKKNYRISFQMALDLDGLNIKAFDRVKNNTNLLNTVSEVFDVAEELAEEGKTSKSVNYKEVSYNFRRSARGLLISKLLERN